ncbi:uncharacterized protein IUM83_16611 [Phytophthora cinnamomi]|uniref:uncharacterized protein n=1 Tax=Phytophthora cinnamomi TaxID=4785 RepID=UPI00355A12C5|nr:hypothetical protein IUM83_16611 [Phytophthora cinnamomi]
MRMNLGKEHERTDRMGKLIAPATRAREKNGRLTAGAKSANFSTGHAGTEHDSTDSTPLSIAGKLTAE